MGAGTGKSITPVRINQSCAFIGTADGHCSLPAFTRTTIGTPECVTVTL